MILKGKKFFLFILFVVMFVNVKYVNAQSASDFLSSGAQSNIISNENFIDTDSMTLEAIQAFLVSNNSFLKDYTDTSSVGANRTAAQIIYDAARGIKHTVPAYDTWLGETFKGVKLDETTGTVSPKVILIFLQKEQSLISKTSRDENALNKAMGYSCPDSGGCNLNYSGFSQQVEWGAWQLRYNYEVAGKPLDWWNTNYDAGNNSINYVGQTKTFVDYTGSYDITIANAATASIYRYTPHVFDSAYNVWNFFKYTYFSGSSPSPDIQPAAPPPPPPRKLGSANGDNIVDSSDLSILADQWGKNVTADTGADFNKDGIVDSTDLSILADQWGK